MALKPWRGRQEKWQPVTSFPQSQRVRALSLVKSDSFVTLWTVARQAPLSMGFSRHGYWSGLPCPPPGDLPDPRIEPESPASSAPQVDPLPLTHRGSPPRSGESHQKDPRDDNGFLERPLIRVEIIEVRRHPFQHCSDVTEVMSGIPMRLVASTLLL